MKGRTAPRIQLTALLTLVLATSAPMLHAQTYTVLYNFGNVSCDPTFPSNAGIIAQGRDGNLYSTTALAAATTMVRLSKCRLRRL